MLSQAIQDYLKAIYKLQGDEPVSTTDLAKELNVSGASVTGMLKRLASMGLIEYNSYHGAKLTPAGEKVALETIRFHRLLELYLKEKLNYPLDKVHDEACRLEHFISEEFIERINKILGEPKFDPHGHPIPSKEGKIEIVPEKSLNDAEPGIIYTISHLEDDNPELLAYLESLGLLPDTRIELIEKQPFFGPITLKIEKSKKQITIGYEVGKRIYIKEA
ncbi:MAG: Mn-dependent transcriptional regulator MntR [Candidatus Kapaibacterium sp.]|jgi:DtxR family Mn-dependent transcriptional regulator|nr:MAG: Mn-dependent transcriptional regulator MntR [Candidatus Kapabacteria bacterium]ROL56426.1 MAG: metal-dependent transcriptional regulator [Bacteroidetes/Chlorobi group bacterium Naka2016]